MASSTNTSPSSLPDQVAQKAIIEQLFDRKLVEGEFWYVIVAEWLEQLKKYLAISSHRNSTRKFYPQRPPPGPILTRRDYAHTVEVVHEDAWRCLVQWYGVADGHKVMKLVVYRYNSGHEPEIEHNLNSFKMMLANSPPENFHNLRFSKMEKVGHLEWKVRDLYGVNKNQQTRLWAKADSDHEWKPLFSRDKAVGKVLSIDSDFTRPIVALEMCDQDGIWSNSPDNIDPNQDNPIGPFYDRDIFCDVTGTWEIDIHEQIDNIGKNFMENLHVTFTNFVQRAQDYVGDRENLIRERERGAMQRENYLDRMGQTLSEKEQHLDTELQSCELRRKDLDRRHIDLEKEYAKRIEEKEKSLDEVRESLEKELQNLSQEREKFENEIKKMSEMHKIQDSKVKLDIGGHLFTTSLLTLTRDPSSMLAAMFSGRHELRKEADDSYFIDRDGTHFRYILNYLRDGGIKEGTLPCRETIWKELLTEAEYFQLNGLVDYLNSLLVQKDYTKDNDTFV